MAKTAPGKHFRKGISIIELFQMFPDDTTAEKWFENNRWGENREHLCCPRCNGDRVKEAPNRKPLPYWCSDCRRHFSVKIGSAMERSKIGYQKWAIGIYMWATSLKGVSSMKLHRDLKITQKSAYFMAQRLREAWPVDTGEPMDGPVEADETHIGGKRKNMSNAKRKELADAGRGAVGKTAIAAVKDRATNQVRTKVVENVDAETLQQFVVGNTTESATVYTDDATAYHSIDRHHESVKHSVSEYVKGQAHTNGVESFWSLLKRGYYGTFHHISEKHLHRYVREFSNRHNARPMDTVEMMREFHAGLIGKRLMYRDLIA